MVSPSHQYPLGSTMSAARRLQLIEWAERAGSWIIEDDYDSEYRYETTPIASLQGLDWNSRVIYIGTFSKVLFPSLRLGYMVIPSDLVEHFISVRFAMDITPPGFFQNVLADFIREGHFHDICAECGRCTASGGQLWSIACAASLDQRFGSAARRRVRTCRSF